VFLFQKLNIGVVGMSLH